jgi:hypothetical protein
LNLHGSFELIHKNHGKAENLDSKGEGKTSNQNETGQNGDVKF